MITLQAITLRREQKVLLEAVDLTIHRKQKIGLIGDNGCGKSSFFAMLAGRLEPNHGTLSLPTHLEIAEVKQEIPTSTRPAIDYVMDGDHQYRALENRLQQAEREGNANLLAKCHDELAHINGYAIPGKAEKLLKGLGFKQDALHNPTTAFSGGWRMRLNLAQALMSRATLMLLDEPTNHLDLDAIVWLEKYLQGYAGTLLIISHDREFLDNTTNYILHFEQQKIKLYSGNYSAFERQHTAQLAAQQAAYVKQRAQIAHVLSFVDRFRAKASKARQVQSRLKALEKMEQVAAVQDVSAFAFTFREPKACPNPLLKIEQATLGYAATQPILTAIDFQIAPSDRLGLLGVNGAGKSTLLKLMAGILQPSSGQVQFYKGIKIGYFAQHQVEQLDLTRSALALLQDLAPDHNEQSLRTFLGSFNFSGQMVNHPITHFSGGEKARLALALIIWQAPNLLLLDEPTNHLDMKMRNAIILALQDYTGALILVSHDRHLLRTTTDELWIINNKKIEQFKGDLDDYKAYLLEKETVTSSAATPIRVNSGKERRKIEAQLKALERELSSLQQEKLALDSLLADPNLYEQQDTNRIRQSYRKQEELTEKIAALEQQWLALSEL